MVDYLEKERFINFCHLVHSKNLVYGSGGNISFRCGDTILITPSGRSLESLTVEDVVEMTFEGMHQGKQKPSSEYQMHIACYEEHPEATAVLHVHSVYATAVSCKKDLNYSKAMPIYTPGYGKRICALPVVPYLLPGSAVLAEAVRNIMRTRTSVLLKNHGVITVGKTAESALNLAEEIEENAQITLLLGNSGEELSASAINDLANYGK